MRRKISDYKRAIYEFLDRWGTLSGNPWHYVPCTEPVPIGDLISPLRMDILVRAEFFEFCARNLDLFADDFPRFYQLACEHLYYVWYRNVNCPRFAPHLLQDERRFRQRFENRIRGAVALYADIERDGFDTKHPIVLQSGEKIHPTSTGKTISRQVFAGDGCHRIALLMSMGETVLRPEYCKIKYSRELCPLDNTSILLRSMPISREEYWAFLSLGYADRVFTTEQDLLAHIRQKKPSSMPEIENIISVDHAFLVERSHEPNSDPRRSPEFSFIQQIHRLSGGAAAARIES